MLTEATKVKTRHHMGYPNVGEVASFALGVPASFQPMYSIETAMNKLLPLAEQQLVTLVAQLDAIEAIILEGAEDDGTSKLGDIEFDPHAMGKQVRRYRHFQATLANLLAVPVNPDDHRFAGGGVNARVRHDT